MGMFKLRLTTKMFFHYVYFNIKSWKMAINSQLFIGRFMDFLYSFFVVANSSCIFQKRTQH